MNARIYKLRSLPAEGSPAPGTGSNGGKVKCPRKAEISNSRLPGLVNENVSLVLKKISCGRQAKRMMHGRVLTHLRSP